MKRQYVYLPTRITITFIWICLLLVTACQSSFSEVVTATPVASVVVLEQPTFTVTPTFTEVALLTPTVTTSTSTPTATATNTPTLTPTPVSTLPPLAALSVVEDLLTHNAYCQLPCWWGTTPGETTWGQVNTLITSLSARISEPSDLMYGTYEIFLPHVPSTLTGHPLGLHLFYHVGEGVIESIKVVGGNMPAYYLQPILANYGPPDEVWLQAMPYTPGGEVIFRIALLYLEKGFSAHIITEQRYLEDQQVVGCFSPESEQGTSLFLWIPGQYSSFPAIVEAGRFGQEASSYLPLEEATGMNITSLLNKFLEDGGGYCISTPIELWEN